MNRICKCGNDKYYIGKTNNGNIYMCSECRLVYDSKWSEVEIKSDNIGTIVNIKGI